jgi:hypothetical protein
MIIAGYTVPTITPADSVAWRESLVARLGAIIGGSPVQTSRPERLRSGRSAIPLTAFFTGTVPDKKLAVQILQLGGALEIVALSAEPTLEWQRILDDAFPRASQAIRLYAGYLGDVFGYLPTAKQVGEGGYEVNGFQSLFGMSGRFHQTRIQAAVTGCVSSALDDLERAGEAAVSRTGAG